MIQEENITTLLDNCKNAVIKKDIVALIDSAKSLGLDCNFHSPLLDFIMNLIIEDIKNFMVQNKKDSIRISRNDIYHQKTFDTYSLENGKLFRNGFKATFTSIGKLYVAYKKIHNIS